MIRRFLIGEKNRLFDRVLYDFFYYKNKLFVFTERRRGMREIWFCDNCVSFVR